MVPAKLNAIHITREDIYNAEVKGQDMINQKQTKDGKT
jgi:hypothetical protein